MFRIKPVTHADKAAQYQDIRVQLGALLDGERDWVCNLANFSSLLFHLLTDLNWAGFYLLKQGQLVLGPFQGKPACSRIALGQGVCGTAAHTKTAQRVLDVHQFPGHIACDPDSHSELVVPLNLGDRLLGVLDLDSPTPGRFDAIDGEQVENLARLLIEGTDWPDSF